MLTSFDPAPPRRDIPGAGRRPRGQHASHQHGVAFKVLRVIGFSVLALALVAVGGGVFAYYSLQSNIRHADISALLGNDRPAGQTATDPTTGNSAVNILVMGSDTRALADGTGNEYGGVGADPGARSDTTILMHLSADRRSARLISIPRDSMVAIPSCATSKGDTKAEVAIFNSAFSEGGAACTVKTVESLTHVRIDDYVVIDFSGFRSMIDALGGVTICLPKAVKDPAHGINLPAGTREVDGETALAYARERYEIGDGSDLGRINRQQALMSSMVQKVTSSQILLRPDKLYAFLSAATKSVTTDSTLANLSQVVKLAQSLQRMPASGVEFITVPTETYPRNKAKVQWTAGAATLWQEILTDAPVGAAARPSATPTTDPSASSQLTVPPRDIALRVVNVGAPAGSARTTAAALSAQGFVVTGTGDGAATAPAAALIRYGSGQADAAATVAAAFPGAVLRADPTLGKSLVVEIGSGAPAVVDVRPRLSTAVTPSAAAPAPAITGRVATDNICT